MLITKCLNILMHCKLIEKFVQYVNKKNIKLVFSKIKIIITKIYIE